MRTLALLLVASGIFLVSSQRVIAQANGSDANHECVISGGAITHLTWSLTNGLPCEATLRTSGVVVVTVEGANPAVARYSLRVADVGTSTTPPAPSPPSPDLHPAAPPAPVFAIQLPDPLTFLQDIETASITDTNVTAREQARVTVAARISAARSFLESVTDTGNGTGNRSLPSRSMCSPAPAHLVILQPKMDNFWDVARSAAYIHTAVIQAVREVTPPVTNREIENAQECIRYIERTDGLSSLLSLGSSAVLQAVVRSQTSMNQIALEGTRLRDSLQSLVFVSTAWNNNEQKSLMQHRDELVRQLNAVITTARTSAENDFSQANVTSITQALQQASDLSDVVLLSRASETVEVNLDNNRSRSRNLVLDWQARSPTVHVEPGSRTVIADRFRGWVVQVTGATGLTGTRAYSVVQEPAFSATTGKIITDSVDLVKDSRYVWRPAISAGLSMNHRWRSGFLFGVGVELAVLSGTNGDATTRVVAPVFYAGRDEMRLFLGALLEGRDKIAFPGDSDRFRVPANAVPTNLVVGRTRGWPSDLYFGIVIGERSLIPTANSR